MTAALPEPSYGWVQSYEVTDDRAVIMICFHAAHGEEIKIRVLPIELDTMIRKAREPRKTERRKRTS